MNNLCNQGAFEIIYANEPMDKTASKISLTKIFEAVETELGFTKRELRGRARQRLLSDARCITMMLIRDYKPKFSKTKIAVIFNRDHSTFCYSEEKFSSLMQTDRVFMAKYNRVKATIEEPAQ